MIAADCGQCCKGDGARGLRLSVSEDPTAREGCAIENRSAHGWRLSALRRRLGIGGRLRTEVERGVGLPPLASSRRRIS